MTELLASLLNMMVSIYCVVPVKNIHCSAVLDWTHIFAGLHSMPCHPWAFGRKMVNHCQLTMAMNLLGR